MVGDVNQSICRGVSGLCDCVIGVFVAFGVFGLFGMFVVLGVLILLGVFMCLHVHSICMFVMFA
jgi:hypothetical protein